MCCVYLLQTFITVCVLYTTKAHILILLLNHSSKNSECFIIRKWQAVGATNRVTDVKRVVLRRPRDKYPRLSATTTGGAYRELSVS